MSSIPQINLKKRLICWICVDLIMLGLALVVFSYFHHVRKEAYSKNVLSPMTVSPTPLISATPVPTPSPQAKEQDDTISPIPFLEPTPNVNGLLQGKFADKFTLGDIEQSEMIYRSANVCIEIQKVQTLEPCLTYFLADIYLQDISSFKTAVALDYAEYNPVSRKTAMEMRLFSSLVDSIISLSGDFFAAQPTGRWAVRNGVELVRRLPLGQDICVLYFDGTMETYSEKAANFDNITAHNPYHIWSFGPALLVDGKATTKFTATNLSGNKGNPRAAIGFYEPGHYCFLLVDGRQKNYSMGMSYAEMSQLFYDLGCTVAYNLDGGDTAVMCWGNTWMSHPQDESPRDSGDLLYIVEPNSVRVADPTVSSTIGGDA